MKLKKIVQRGQVMVLYALLVPLMFLFVGVGIDLGWYYLNVSRLQNAADAAVLAGAWKLVERDATLKEYYVTYLTDGKPSDFNSENYNAYILNDSGGYVSKEVGKENAEKEARLYANQNLTDVALEHSGIENRTNVINEWNVSQDKHKTKKNVEFKAVLYSKMADTQLEERNQKSANGIKYYVVTLSEQIGHLFFQGGIFKPMDATVVAYAMLRPREKDLNTSVSHLKDEHTIENWEYQNKFHNYTENWNHYRQTIDGGKKIAYKTGDDFRTETVNITKEMGSTSNNTNTSAGQKTSANGNKWYDEYNVDAINIDFNQDFSVKRAVTKDWDIRQPTTVDGATVEYIRTSMSGWDENHGYDLRIQGLINFNDVWRNRNLLDSDTNNNLKADPLWARIESDPMWSKGVAWGGSQTTLNSVHQMIITINRDNTEAVDKDENGNTIVDSNGNECKAYKYRPLFLTYMGPESNEVNSTIRQSQPVIINLNADFNGIFYMPNSPVVINGNGHKLNGFVIAKEYRFLTTDDDYIANGYIAVTDEYGHTIFAKEDQLRTKEQVKSDVNSEHGETTLTETSAGDLQFYEKIIAPEYLIIDARHVKGLSGYEDEYIKTLKYYKKITDAETVKIIFPRDEDTFDGFVNTATYTVAQKDLSDTQQSGYVAVLVNGETKYIAKTNLPYVRVYRKSNGDLYPYVPVCDLRVKKTTSTTYESAGGSHPYGYAGVTLADDDHDAYKDGKLKSDMTAYKIDDSMDTWKVERNVLESNSDCYQNIYKKSGEIIKTVDDTEGRYFMLKSEMPNTERKVIAEYRKVTKTDDNGQETVLYIKEATTEEYNENGASYYMKVTQSAGTDLSNNPIIVDNKGDLQTKTLTPEKVFTLKTESENVALKKRMESIWGLASEADLKKYWNEYTRYPNGTPGTDRAEERPIEIPMDKGVVENGRYIGSSNAHKNEDYRIPALERVYLKSTFNLSADSYYSYFNIPELERVNYTYLNVDELNGDPEFNLIEDMFFTTTRASWVD